MNHCALTLVSAHKHIYFSCNKVKWNANFCAQFQSKSVATDKRKLLSKCVHVKLLRAQKRIAELSWRVSENNIHLNSAMQKKFHFSQRKTINQSKVICSTYIEFAEFICFLFVAWRKCTPILMHARPRKDALILFTLFVMEIIIFFVLAADVQCFFKNDNFNIQCFHAFFRTFSTKYDNYSLLNCLARKIHFGFISHRNRSCRKCKKKC